MTSLLVRARRPRVARLAGACGALALLALASCGDDDGNRPANPAPVVASMTPLTTPAAGDAFVVTINGSGFTRSSVVQWDGTGLPTTFVSATQLTATVSATDIATPGRVAVNVRNPTPGGGTSGSFDFVIGNPVPNLRGIVTANVQAKDIVWDRVRNRIYASLPSAAGEIGNSVAIIDPATGSVVNSVFVGSEPGTLAISDDASVLYVALDGSAKVRRVNLATFTAGLEFGVWSTGTLYAEDIEVMPGTPGTVAISLKNPASSPRLAALAIYDDGVRRPTTGPGHTGSNRIEFGTEPTMLYGYNNETTEFGFRLNTVSAAGVTETWVSPGLISGFDADIEFDGGRVYATTGAVVDPVTRTRVATIPTTGFVRPDAQKSRVYFLDAAATIRAYTTTTFTSTGSLAVPGVGAATGSFIRWGTDGLAFRTADKVVIVRTNLVP